MPKTWGCAPFCLGVLVPHLAQCDLGRNRPPYQVASWSIQPFGHNRDGPKIEGVPIWGTGAGSPSNNVASAGSYLQAKFHFDPSNRLATIHRRYRQERQTRQTDKQRSNSIWQAVLQTVAQNLGRFGHLFFHWLNVKLLCFHIYRYGPILCPEKIAV